MWQAATENIPPGCKYRLRSDQTPLSFRDLFRLLEYDDAFAAWYTRLLADCEYLAFYWEHPPLTTESLDHDAEFVLVNAPVLARMPPDPAPFQERFDTRPEDDVLVFPNLGHDAILVVPRNIDAFVAYPHLAAFVRHAPEAQIRSLWKRVAQAVYQNVTTAPTWLSTAGLGVAWLHVRLDSRPKYYSHVPYKQRP